MRIKINEAGLRRVARGVRDEVSGAMHKIIERVGREMAGEPEDDVYTRLVSEMQADLGAHVTPDDPALRKIAAEISADERAED